MPAHNGWNHRFVSPFIHCGSRSGTIMPDLKNPRVGVFSRPGRSLLGLLVPVLGGVILVSKRVNQKRIFSVLLVSMLAGCAGLWWVSPLISHHTLRTPSRRSVQAARARTSPAFRPSPGSRSPSPRSSSGGGRAGSAPLQSREGHLLHRG